MNGFDRAIQVGGGGGVPGGVDFTGCVSDPDTGFCCVEKLEQVKQFLLGSRTNFLTSIYDL